MLLLIICINYCSLYLNNYIIIEVQSAFKLCKHITNKNTKFI